jgi:hypothetical protein
MKMMILIKKTMMFLIKKMMKITLMLLIKKMMPMNIPMRIITLDSGSTVFRPGVLWYAAHQF